MNKEKIALIVDSAKMLGHNPTLDKIVRIAEAFTLTELKRINTKIKNTGRRVA
jgi:hypothetical protein